MASELETYVRAIALKISAGKSEDISFQFPAPNEDTIELASGAKYEKSYNIFGKLRVLSVSAPKGIVIRIYKDDVIWRRYTNCFGSMSFPTGEIFQKLTVSAENINTDATADPVQWMVETVIA